MAIYYEYIKPLIRELYYSFFASFLNILSCFLFWIRPKPVNKEQVQRILLIKMERLGDLVLTTPAIRAIRQHFPLSTVSIVVNSYSRDIIGHDPHLDEVFVFDAQGIHKTLKGKIQFIKRLRLRKFDLAIDLSTRDFLLLPPLLLYLSGAKVTVGLNNLGRGFLFNIKAKPYPKPRPLTKEIFHILFPLGITYSDTQPKLFLSGEDKDDVEQYLRGEKIREDDILVGIHPGGYFETIRWTKEGYAKVADYLMTRYNAKVFFVGGTKERDLADEIAGLMANTPFNHAGKTSLGQLMALTSKCHLFIGGSSGPFNIALGFDIPTISFMGPSIPERWRPQGEKHIVFRRDLSCSPCESGYCWKKDFRCMTDITTQEVIKAVDKQISSAKG